MGLINKPHTLSTNPSISADVGQKIDDCLNVLYNEINGGLDDSNVDGTPAIQSSKLSLGGAGFLPLAGGNMSSTITHAFEGLWRAMGASGLVREYRSNAGGNILWGISYNTYHNGTSWTGRDISDICLRVEISKTTDGWGGLRIYLADSLGAGATPVWNPVQHYEPMGGHSRYSSGGAWSSFVGDTTITVDPAVSGIFHYNNLTLTGTWTLEQGKPLIIFARESVTINGLITGDGKGALGGAGSTSPANASAGSDSIAGGTGGGGGGSTIGGSSSGGNGGSSIYFNTSIGGVGGNAANGTNGNTAPYIRLLRYLLNTTSIVIGGSGGGGSSGSTGKTGGNGGGYIYIEAPIITLNTGAILRCNGSDGLGAVDASSGSSGGGGGGVIHIRGKSIINNGTVFVSGGIGSTTGYDGGNGGAGVIYIEEYR